MCVDDEAELQLCLHAAQHLNEKRKPAGLLAAGLNPFQGRMEETEFILGKIGAEGKSAKRLDPCRISGITAERKPAETWLQTAFSPKPICWINRLKEMLIILTSMKKQNY